MTLRQLLTPYSRLLCSQLQSSKSRKYLTSGAAPGLAEVLEIQRQSQLKGAYRDGKRDMAAQFMTELAGTFWGFPFTLTVEWPEGEPPPDLWAATRRIAASASADA